MSQDYRLAAAIPLSWEAMHRDARALADKLRAKGPFGCIVAVTRGGLVPAAILARELDIRLVETVCVASYDNRAQAEVEILKAVSGDGAGWLVVDDLVDSGATVQALRTLLPQAHFATLYAKPAGLPLVDTYAAQVDQDVWIVFPWEAAPKED